VLAASVFHIGELTGASQRSTCAPRIESGSKDKDETAGQGRNGRMNRRSKNFLDEVPWDEHELIARRGSGFLLRKSSHSRLDEP